MELMNQPFTGQLGNRLIELLDLPGYHTLNIAVAFAKNSGVLRIKDALERFRERGGKVNVYVGVDLGGTSYEALATLLLHTDSLNVVHSEKGQTFHPKIYQFVGKDKGLVVVGSHNLTAGGLWTNFESSVLIPADGSSAHEVSLLKGLDDYIKSLASLKDSVMSIGARYDIDKLLQNGYVSREVADQVRRAKAAKRDGSRKPLFGNGAPAKLPGVTMPKKGKAAAPIAPAGLLAVPSSDEDLTFWMETRGMTGGSTNILDLSKKSLVERGTPKGTLLDLGDPKFMRGAVEFFGVDPATTEEVKNITLNFEGNDYENNTILYAPNNGSWRLQMKGAGPAGKITDAFKDIGGDEYLKYKVVAFARIQDDYYSLSVFPASELENFKAASRVLARNGANTTARQIGLL